MAWDVEANPDAYADVLAWFRARVPVTEAEFARIVGNAHAKAFKVAGVTDLETVATVWEALDGALEDGTDFSEFQASVGDLLTEAWGYEDTGRLDTIFRTNIQSAYGAGRMVQQRDPDVLVSRPYWRYVAILDSRTSSTCRPLDGITLPADHPFWSRHQPPLHFNCRSTVISLTPEQADDLGVSDDPPDVDPQPGFGNPLAEWTPDLSSLPAPLVAHARSV